MADFAGMLPNSVEGSATTWPRLIRPQMVRREQLLLESSATADDPEHGLKEGEPTGSGDSLSRRWLVTPAIRAMRKTMNEPAPSAREHLQLPGRSAAPAQDESNRD